MVPVIVASLIGIATSFATACAIILSIPVRMLARKGTLRPGIIVILVPGMVTGHIVWLLMSILAAVQ